MALLRLLITGDADTVSTISKHLDGIEGVERVEPVDDLMDHLDDADSSSAGLSDNAGGSQLTTLEVETDSDEAPQAVRDAVLNLSRALDVVVEIESDSD
ncbi:hypothetical protein H4O09_03955 [Stenotrophomonas sp. W1S232]|uniref:Uncharacterized protein n=1 Tax=Stenotrophomonas koreensis TaxID=266128 RepID=A0A7W3YUW2_9GAMM|nr:hypothetical protein [Stenotrophomonas koreensis]MBB1116224.1 hypothetical protein [Stenotrophomonas koreensis]